MPVQHRYQIEEVSTPEQLEEALCIRFDVFIKEQGVSPETESDEYDAIDPHWLVRNEEGEAIATARVTDRGNGMGKLERVCVLDVYRDHGIGKLLLTRIEEDLRAKGFAGMEVHAQTHCQGFYEKQGFMVKMPEVFYEEEIPHIHMVKALQ